MANIPEAKVRIKAKDETKKGVNSAKSGFKSLSAEAIKLTGIITGVTGVAGLAGFAQKTIDAGDRALDLSTRLGVSVEAITELGFAAEQTGVSAQTLELGLQKLTRKASEAAAGIGDSRDAFAELGINVERLNQLKPELQFEAVADALKEVAADGDRTRLAVKLFDTEGAALLQTMEGGAESIRALREEAASLGRSLSTEQAEQMSAANDAVGRLQAAFQGLGFELANNSAPALEAVANFLTANLPSAVEFTTDAFFELRKVVALAISSVLTGLEKIYSALSIIPGVIGDTYENLSLEIGKFRDSVLLTTSEIEIARGQTQQLNIVLQEQGDITGIVSEQIKQKFQTEQQATAVKKELTTAEKEYNDLQRQALGILERYKSETQKLAEDMMILNQAVEQNIITQEQYRQVAAQVLEDVNEGTDESIDKNRDLERMYGRLGDTAVDSLERIINGTGDWKDSLFGVLRVLGDIIVQQNNSASLAANGGSGLGRGFDFGTIASIGSSIASFFSFADGGIMTPNGALPLNTYATGGVANSPQLALFGEGRQPEAYVPLPDGRSIPVSMQGGGGGENITINYSPQINAIDTQSGIEFLAEHKDVIVSMIQQYKNRKGQSF